MLFFPFELAKQQELGSRDQGLHTPDLPQREIGLRNDRQVLESYLFSTFLTQQSVFFNNEVRVFVGGGDQPLKHARGFSFFFGGGHNFSLVAGPAAFLPALQTLLYPHIGIGPRTQLALVLFFLKGRTTADCSSSSSWNLQKLLLFNSGDPPGLGLRLLFYSELWPS